ncbi:MAG: hypothetical protein KAR20_10510, partial [Candidatus Heimdallarchaeota archaeon]|nr:hypothetical protein [Candidatus Heimdallarchaeota archaeon]
MVFDAGSKALKCAIADENGSLIHIESIIPRVIQSSDGFGRKWDEELYWGDLLALAQKSITKAAINPKDIRYISTCSIRPSCVFCTEDFTPIYIGASFDIQGIDYGDEIEDQFYEHSGTSLYESTGHFPSFLMIPARLRWLQNNPSLYLEKKISHYLPLDSWILIKFGAEFHTNISSATESGFFDIHQKIWHDAWYSIFNISEDFFAPAVHSGEIVGNITREMQEKMHFSADLELVAGIPDTHASLLAVNAVTPGSISAILGSTTPVQGITAKLECDSEQQSWRSLLAIKNICDLAIIEANTGITGQVIKWAAYFFSDIRPNSSSQSISSCLRHLD